MTTLPGPLPREVDEALGRLDDLVSLIEAHPDTTVRDAVLEMLRAVDVIHRGALQRVRALLETRALLNEAVQDPHVELLFGLYDERADDEWERVEAALERVRPAIEAHGGQLKIVAAEGGVVNIQLLGSCEGCSASAAPLRDLAEQALRAELPEFVRLDVAQPATRSAPPVLIPASSLTRRGASGERVPDASGGGLASRDHGCAT